MTRTSLKKIDHE